MNIEEFRKEAKEYAEKHYMTSYFAQADIYVNDKEEIINAILYFAEPREKRITVLEKRCANYEMENSKMEKGICDICKEIEKDRKLADLEKENAELKSECRRCAHTDRLCVLSDYGKDRNGICDHFKDVFDEVAELKGLKDVATLIKANNDTVITLMQLNNMLVSKNQQLTKAKEIIKKLLCVVRNHLRIADVSFNALINDADKFLQED